MSRCPCRLGAGAARVVAGAVSTCRPASPAGWTPQYGAPATGRSAEPCRHNRPRPTRTRPCPRIASTRLTPTPERGCGTTCGPGRSARTPPGVAGALPGRVQHRRTGAPRSLVRALVEFRAKGSSHDVLLVGSLLPDTADFEPRPTTGAEGPAEGVVRDRDMPHRHHDAARETQSPSGPSTRAT